MSIQAPHILTLSLLDDDPDPDCPGFWDTAELICPFDPPLPAMPCAVWDLCGCKPKRSEISEPEWGNGAGPCPSSLTGIYHYVEGEPQKPLAECWAVDHADDLDYAARDLDVPCGQYRVIPICEDNSLKLELIQSGEHE